jgi:hypothetical protein
MAIDIEGAFVEKWLEKFWLYRYCEKHLIMGG